MQLQILDEGKHHIVVNKPTNMVVVAGRGVPKPKGAGDLLVSVEVAVPAKLSTEERKAVEALAAATSESPRSHLGV